VQSLQQELARDYANYDFHFVAQKLQGFCSEDLGGFYLDILKDRLYTAGADSVARRSAQNALHHIAHSLVRLMAPILSFTAEEAWAVLCGKENESVFTGEWHTLPDSGMSGAVIGIWRDIRNIRELVNKKLEEKRAAGEIGSALAAEVDVFAFGEAYESLKQLGGDLKFVFITSRAALHLREGGGLGITVTPSELTKCERCWHYRTDVGSDANHATLCGRCVSNLYGGGEARKYA